MGRFKLPSLTLNGPGYFWSSKTGGGVESTPPWFFCSCNANFHSNHRQMVSNESWHLYTPLESLKTILSSVVFLQDAVEVT